MEDTTIHIPSDLMEKIDELATYVTDKYVDDCYETNLNGYMQFTQEAQEFYTEVYDRVEDVIIKELSR